MFENDLTPLIGKKLKEVHFSNIAGRGRSGRLPFAFGTLKLKNVQEITLECDDDSSFYFYHLQDCCEHVEVWDIKGDFCESEIVEVEERKSQEWPEDVPLKDSLDCFTWTTHKIKFSSGREVAIRWLAESNGWYSERVYFGRTHNPF